MRLRTAIMVPAALVLSVTLPIALAAPRPRDASKPVLYYPINVGEQWVLGFDMENGTNMAPLLVTSAVEKDGITTVKVANVDRDGTPGLGFTVEVSEKGVCMVENPSGRFDDPRWLLKLPAKPGSKWEVPIKDPGRKPETMVRTVVGEEEVITPAGTFKAVRVDIEFPVGTPWLTEWWAVGRGKVKQSGSPVPLVLKSITPGKK